MKSTAFESVSCPSGLRTMLAPGGAVDGGAAATVPSTNAFVADPQPTESTSAPLASRIPTPPPGDGTRRRPPTAGMPTPAGPAGPGPPAAPAAPAGPGGPAGPATPGVPCGPAGPAAPGSPFGPA